MSTRLPGSNSEARHRFLADPKALAELGLSLADLDDPVLRAALIRHEHPELDRALREGQSEIELEGVSVNARLHLAMHEILATQLWENDPPEVGETAERLTGAGYRREEVLHMLATPIAEQIWGALGEERPYDRDRPLADLAALPGSWERGRARRPAGRPPQGAGAARRRRGRRA